MTVPLGFPSLSPGSGIVGVGFDVCDHARIERVWRRFGDRFLRKIYTSLEVNRIFRGHDHHDIHRLTPPQIALVSARLARGFAAKEAASKALGTGIARGVNWTHMEVVHAAGGAPGMVFHHQALKVFHARLNKQSGAIHVTSTSESGRAYSLVILVAMPG